MSAAEANPMDPARKMRDILEHQRRAHLKDGPASAEKRIEWLDRSIDLLIGHKDAIADALREDFGHRSVQASLFTDVSGPARGAVRVGPMGEMSAVVASDLTPSSVAGFRKTDAPFST